MKKNRCKRSHSVWFYFYKMPRESNSIPMEGRAVVPGAGAAQAVSAQGPAERFGAGGGRRQKRPKPGLWGWLCAETH